MYATSMKDRLVAAARAKARELQEAAKPGSAAPELEEALDAAEGKRVEKGRRARKAERAGTEDTPAGDAVGVAASGDDGSTLDPTAVDTATDAGGDATAGTTSDTTGATSGDTAGDRRTTAPDDRSGKQPGDVEAAS